MRIPRRSSLLSLAALLVSGTALAQAPAQAATSARTTAAARPLGVTAGPLFARGARWHSCTASVIHSPHGDLVATAAHCVRGTGAGMTFAPGYVRGTAPYGTWTVTASYAPSSWLRSQSPTADLAILRVAPRVIKGVSRSIESVVGGARIGTTPRAGTRVTVVGYPAGVGGSARVCTKTTWATAGYPGFTCSGYPDGTSGSPWLTSAPSTGPVLVGVLGGLHHGGCSPNYSYSSPIGSTLSSLATRAATARRSDSLPIAGSDGC